MKRRVVDSLPSAAAESTPRKQKFEIDHEENGIEYEGSDFGELASPYLKPCLYNARFLGKQ